MFEHKNLDGKWNAVVSAEQAYLSGEILDRIDHFLVADESEYNGGLATRYHKIVDFPESSGGFDCHYLAAQPFKGPAMHRKITLKGENANDREFH